MQDQQLDAYPGLDMPDRMAEAIATSSPVNLHGEFAFSDEALKNSLRLAVEALVAFQWEPSAGPLG